MAKGTCLIADCTGTIVARSLCRNHYNKWWTEHRVDAARCSVNGCNWTATESSLCVHHHAERQICTVEGCNDRRYCRGWCVTHYNKWFAHGDPTYERVLTRRGQPCSVVGCVRPIKCKELCGTHYQRLRTRGNTGSAELERSRDVIHGTPAGYNYRRCRCIECCEADRNNDQVWRNRNRDSVRRSQARHRALHAERINRHKRQWKYANPDKVRGYIAARSEAPFDADALEYSELIRSDPCVYCGAPSTDIDHIVPVVVSHSSDWMNLAPSCDRCNSSKGAKSLLRFLMYRLRAG